MYLNLALICSNKTKQNEKLKFSLTKMGFSKLYFVENSTAVKNFFIEREDKTFLIIIDFNEEDRDEKAELLDFIKINNEKNEYYKVATLIINDNKKNLTSKVVFNHTNLNIINSDFTQAFLHTSVEDAFSKVGVNIEASKIIEQRTHEYRTRFLENINKRIILGDDAHAEYMLKKKLEYETDWAYGYLSLASILIDKRKFEEAIKSLKTAKAISEENYISLILFKKIEALTGINYNDNEIDLNKTFEAKTEISPLNEMIYDSYELLKKGHIQGAEEKFKKVLSIDSDSIDARIGLVKIAQKRDRKNEVKSILLTMPCPDIVAIEFNLKAIDAIKKGDLKTALLYYKECDNYIMTSKKRPSLNYNIGLLYVKLQDYINAKKYLTIAKEGGSKSAENLINKLKEGNYSPNMTSEDF